MTLTDRPTLMIAVALALFLWASVRMQQDTPDAHRIFRRVPVTVDIASGWAFRFATGDSTIDVQVKGPADRVNSLTRDDIHAHVAITHPTRISSLLYPVVVDRITGVELAGRLPRVRVDVFPLQRKTFPVTVAFIATPPPGTTVGKYLLQPANVVVEGIPDDLRQVKYVNVYVDPHASMTSERDLIPRAVTADGERITEVSVLTSTVKARMGSLTGEQTTRQIAVRSPELVSLPAHSTVSVVRVRPDVVTLSGDAAALGRLDAYVSTDPLDVGTVTGDTTRTVHLRVPSGLKVLEGTDILVDLRVTPRSFGGG